MRIASILLLSLPLLGSCRLAQHEAPDDIDRWPPLPPGLERRDPDAFPLPYLATRHVRDRRARRQRLQRRLVSFTSPFKPSFNPPAQGFARPSRWQPANKNIQDINRLSWTHKAEKWVGKNDAGNRLQAERAAVDGLHHLEGQGKESPKADSMLRAGIHDSKYHPDHPGTKVVTVQSHTPDEHLAVKRRKKVKGQKGAERRKSNAHHIPVDQDGKHDPTKPTVSFVNDNKGKAKVDPKGTQIYPAPDGPRKEKPPLRAKADPKGFGAEPSPPTPNKESAGGGAPKVPPPAPPLPPKKGAGPAASKSSPAKESGGGAAAKSPPPKKTH